MNTEAPNLESTIEDSKRCSASVAIHKQRHRKGNLLYVLIDDRAAFDLIDLTEGGDERVRAKVIEGDMYVVSQYWIKRSGL